MLLKLQSRREKRGDGPWGGLGRRRGRVTDYFALGVLAASSFSAKVFCCLSNFCAKANDASVISSGVGSSGP
jgi:hypothetical protein